MFNENTLKDMETVDSLVSEKNEELFKGGSNLFLSWTFPTNHSHQQQLKGENYFVIWVGETGKYLLKTFCFGRIGMIPKFLSNASETELQKTLDRVNPFEI